MEYSLWSMSGRQRSNPLALAVLAVLHEQPRHPYDISATLRERQKHESIRLNYGSLYNVIGGLQRAGFVHVVDRQRDGNRPARTVYGITEAGEYELTDWLSDLVSTLAPEFPAFDAALSLLPCLPPDAAIVQLRRRLEALAAEQDRVATGIAQARAHGVARLFVLEAEHARVRLRAEFEFTELLVELIEDGSLEGVDEWRAWYQPDATDGAQPTPPAAPVEPAEPTEPTEPTIDPAEPSAPGRGGARPASKRRPRR